MEGAIKVCYYCANAVGVKNNTDCTKLVAAFTHRCLTLYLFL